jgi:hypothetical protein
VSASDLSARPAPRAEAAADRADAEPDVAAARRRHRLCLLAIGASLTIYAAIVVRDFSGPIGDHVESFLYEYLSYYVSKNLTFGPLPHLGLDNDQAFYPFGTNVGLQSFCVERDLLFTFLARTFGRGPWLQLYYVGGLIAAAYGSFGLLRKQHGDVRATVAAILITCFNFYGAQKYPYHFNMACVHWTTLAIVCDFVIVERLVTRRQISLQLVLLRVLLVVLSFGLELGHVLGYTLTSALATCVFAGALLVVRRVRRARGQDAEPSDLARFWSDGKAELRAHWGRLAGLFAAIVAFSLLYGSIVVQIVLSSRQFDFKGVPLGVWWSQPVRLLIPYFPWIHPSQQPKFLRVWEDQAEVGIGSGGAGLFLLVLAIIGLVQAKRRLRYLPLFIVFAMYVVSRPGFDLVRWMPWFAFTRVFSRATVIYSTMLGLFAMGVTFEGWQRHLKWGMTLLLSALGGLELYTFGTIKMSHPAFAFDDRFMNHMKAIEALPGEAVLDFPFCILGGNGDQAYLCPFMERLKSVYALQRFHHKKVIGQYLGRVHPSQTKPFVDQGWPKLWDTDDSDPIEADKQVRCLTDAEWEFFSGFFEKNDFAGIQLAIDRLPEGCPEEFYKRYGAPMGEVSIPKAGRLAFIKRPPELHDRLDREGGKKVHLSVELTSSVETIRQRHPVVLDVNGLSGYEWRGDSKNDREHWRWALAPETEFTFDVSVPREIVAELRFHSPIPKQVITVLMDGREVQSLGDFPQELFVTRTVRVPVTPGHHTMLLRYKFANLYPTEFAPKDPRPLTVQYWSLVLRAEPMHE